jgi:hypothetical protein
MLYPERLQGRVGRLIVDIMAVLWTAAWAIAGYQVYQVVMALQVVADGITSTGHTFNSWIQAFRSATPHNIPGLSAVLGDLANTLQRSGGDPLIRNGMEAHDRIHQLATVLGILVALIPIVAVIGSYLVWRVRDVRALSAAGAFVRYAERSGRVEEANAVLAHRAVALLPFRQLMRASPDPIRDLAEGRHEALAAAMLRHTGMQPLRAHERR